MDRLLRARCRTSILNKKSRERTHNRSRSLVLCLSSLAPSLSPQTSVVCCQYPRTPTLSLRPPRTASVCLLGSDYRFRRSQRKRHGFTDFRCHAATDFGSWGGGCTRRHILTAPWIPRSEPHGERLFFFFYQRSCAVEAHQQQPHASPTLLFCGQDVAHGRQFACGRRSGVWYVVISLVLQPPCHALFAV